jgi:phage tail-like protein
MMAREMPYGNFNFLVEFSGGGVSGGFSDVSGLGTEITIAEYRAGNSRVNHVQKIPGLHQNSDVTLKRGVINSKELWEWIDDVRNRGPLARRDVTIVLQDESHERDVQKWLLINAFPKTYTGPTLAAKGGSDVAMEEWVLAFEALRLEQVES